MATLTNTIINDTGYIQVASGTSAQRTGTTNGMVRYNTTRNTLEVYSSSTSAWYILAGGLTVQVLIVAGGGFKQLSLRLGSTDAYSVTVGGGGGVTLNANGTQGTNSTFGSITATGGGYGAAGPVSIDGNAGGNGGSGGGAGYGSSLTTASLPGTGNAGEGCRGSYALNGSNTANNVTSGGGGGAGGPGINANAQSDGAGGAAVLSTIFSGGASFSGGGSGSGNQFSFSGAPGTNAGQGNSFNNGGNATANRGGGGGGGGYAGTTGGTGGSGIVVVKYLGTVSKATGGTITNDGTYTYHTFTAAGTFTVT